MKKLTLVGAFAFIFFSTNFAFAQTEVTENIESTTVWSLENSPYLIRNDISVSNGVTLTIEAGTIIKLEDGKSIVVDGRLDSLGSANNPVVITSIHDDSVGGDSNGNGSTTLPGESFSPPWGSWVYARWGTVRFAPGSSGNLQHTQVRYGGGSYIYDDFPSIENSGTLSILNSELKSARMVHIKQVSGQLLLSQSEILEGPGAVGVKGGEVTIENNEIHTVDYGLLIDSSNPVIFNNNQFYDSYSPISLWLTHSTPLSYSDNTVVNNYHNGIVLRGPVMSNIELSGGDLVYIVSNGGGDNPMTRNLEVELTNDLSIDVDASLSFVDGAVLKLDSYSRLLVEGTLNIGGDHGQPIIVTSLFDNQTGGAIWDEDNRDPNSNRWAIIDMTEGSVVTAQHGAFKYNAENRFYTGALFHNRGGNLAVSWSNMRDSLAIAHKAGQTTVHNSHFGANYTGIQNFTTDIIDAANNYWDHTTGPIHSGNPSGQGAYVSDYVTYSPWLNEPPQEGPIEDVDYPASASSVLFLPGIQASRLYVKNTLGFEDELWTPLHNGDVRQLAMTAAGQSENDIYTRDIIDSATGLGSVYAGISNYFDTLVAEEKIADWEPFAYDWRYSVEDIVKNGTLYETERKYVLELVETLAEGSDTGKVSLVGHSNGGLLTKVIVTELEKLGKADLIDQVVLLASPQTGTPKAVGSILHGYDQDILGGLILKADVAREVIQNLPGAYALLPTQEYFEDTNGAPVVVFEDIESTSAFIDAYGAEIADVDKLYDFMSGQGGERSAAESVYEPIIANGAILDDTARLHNDVLQTWRAPESVKVTEVAGIGLPTIHSFAYRAYLKRDCASLIHIECQAKLHYQPVPRLALLGDETVVTSSALAYRGEKDSYYFDLNTYKDNFTLKKHHNFTEAEPVQNLLSNILFSATNTTPFISKVKSSVSDSYVMMGVHSPAMATITDSEGRQIKVEYEGDFLKKIEDIPDAYIYYFGETTYIILPNGGEYQVELEGTGEGLVTLEIDEIVQEGNMQTTLQSIILDEVGTSTVMKTTLHNSALSDVLVDQDGDGEVDKQIDAVTNEVTVLSTPAVDEESDNMASTRSGGGGGGVLRSSTSALHVAGVQVISVEASQEIKQLMQLYELLVELKRLLILYENTAS